MMRSYTGRDVLVGIMDRYEPGGMVRVVRPGGATSLWCKQLRQISRKIHQREVGGVKAKKQP